MNQIKIFSSVAVLSVLAVVACNDEKKAAPAPEKTTEAATDPAEPAKTEPPPTTDSKTAEAPAVEKTANVQIEPFGYQLEMPESWKGKQLNDMAFKADMKSVKAGGITMLPTFVIMKMPPSKETLDEASCTKGKLIEKKAADDGAFYYICEMEVAGQKMLNLEWIVPIEDGTLRCNGAGPDISAMQSACKSLRKI